MKIFTTDDNAESTRIDSGSFTHPLLTHEDSHNRFHGGGSSRGEESPSHRHDKRVDDGAGERVPDEGDADCLREGMLETKIVNTHSLEVVWQQRLLVLGMDKLFLCKPSDRQYVYDHCTITSPCPKLSKSMLSPVHFQ